MKLVVFVLNRGELLHDVLAAYVEAGMSGATVLDSEGIGRFLAYEMPLFADFKDVMTDSKPSNKTILSVVQHEEKIPILERLLDEICGGLDHPGTGVFFTVPVDYMHGMVREEAE